MATVSSLTFILGLFAVIGLVVVIPTLAINRQPSRVLHVAAGSAAAFIGLAFIIYWVYFSIGDAVYDPRLNEGLAALQVVFFTAFALHMLGSLGAAAALTRWARAPIYPTLAVVALIFVILALPTLGALTGFNSEHFGVDLPFPGQGYR